MSYVNTATDDAASRIRNNQILRETITRWVCKGMKTYKQFCELLDVPYGTVDGYAVLSDIADYLMATQVINPTRFNKVMDYLNAETYDTDYLKVSECLAAGELPQSKEDNMKFETKHLINGQDVASYSTEDKINLIAKTEKRIAELSAITTQSALVAAEIAKAQAFLAAIVAQFDANVG